MAIHRTDLSVFAPIDHEAPSHQIDRLDLLAPHVPGFQGPIPPLRDHAGLIEYLGPLAHRSALVARLEPRFRRRPYPP